MSSDLAISVRGVCKTFRVPVTEHKPTTLSELIVNRIRHPFARRKPDSEFEALTDVSFEARRGDVIGIIGRNGAGKSTLLKILSRITPPTRGEIDIHGRVGSLLEVGTGFHPELTGRENIFLNGTFLGMRRAEILRRFDEIVAFSEVEQFLDTPVKRYSSGMYVRLAFAVAAHLEPEILIVDEVLAVGDASFQKKCLGKMGDVARKDGRTVLFVSHNMTAVKTLCSTGILLRKGAVCAAGNITEVVNAYASDGMQEVTGKEWPSWDKAPGSDSVRFKSIKLVPESVDETNHITVKNSFDVVIELMASRVAEVNLSLQINLLSGEVVFAIASPIVEISPQGARYTCHFPGDFLNDETYTLNAMIVENCEGQFVLQDALSFEIHDIARAGSWLGKWPGLIRPNLKWDCQQNLEKLS